MYSIKPQLISMVKLKTETKDTPENQFKKAIQAVITKLKEYQTLRIDSADLIDQLAQDIYDPEKKDDRELNRIRQILKLSSDQTNFNYAISYLTAIVWPTASHTKFLTFLAILKDRSHCVDSAGKMQPDKIITVIKSLFNKHQRISLDQKHIAQVTFNAESSELHFGDDFPNFKLTAYIKENQDLDLNHIDELIRYGNVRFSKKYETGSIYDNNAGICTECSYAFLNAEAKAYWAQDKPHRTQALKAFHQMQISRRENKHAPITIKKYYAQQCSAAKNQFESQRFFRVPSIKGRYSEFSKLIKQDGLFYMQEYDKSKALYFLSFEQTDTTSNPLDQMHSIALSVTKKITCEQSTYVFKIMDPNTEEGPALLEIQEKDLEKSILDFSRNIFYFGHQLKVDTQFRVDVYLPHFKPSSRKEAMELLKKITASESWNWNIQSNEAVAQIIEYMQWTPKETIEEILKEKDWKSFESLLKTVFVLHINKMALSKEKITEELSLFPQQERDQFVAEFLSEIQQTKPFRSQTWKTLSEANAAISQQQVI